MAHSKDICIVSATLMSITFRREIMHEEYLIRYTFKGKEHNVQLFHEDKNWYISTLGLNYVEDLIFLSRQALEV